MSVNPLDLQVNFTQMNQVGKQQSLIKENQILRQDLASEELQKDGNKNSEGVPETKNLSEGPQNIKDEQKKKNMNKNNNRDQDKEEENKKNTDIKNDSKNKNVKILIDPTLGQNIDIMG